MKIFKAEPLYQHYLHDVDLGVIDRLLIKSQLERPDFNRRMFDEDFSRLFRSVTRRDGKLFEIVSSDDELSQKLLANVKTRYSPNSVDETIRELVEEIAQTLIWSGRAFYCLHDDSEQDQIHLVSLSSSGVIRLIGRHIQWVPKRKVRHWDRDDEEFPREIRILDEDKLMRFEMPTPIQGMLSAQNRTLSTLDKHKFEMTNFQPKVTHENPEPASYFDFKVWNKTNEHALYRATRSTGWNCRKYDSSKRSDFFDCYRMIRFRRNQLTLRDSILSQISRELSRVGKGYKADFSIEILGTDLLPSVAHLNELQDRLAREDAGFNEVIDYCHER